MKYLTSLKNKDLSKEICLLRVDFNITNAELSGMMRRTTWKLHPRLAAVLPTIKFLIKRGAKVIILSHRGRPEIKQKEFSLKLFAKILSKLLNKPVQFIDFNFGTSDVLKLTSIKNSPSSSVFLLENLRFLPGEDKNDKKFAKQLASLATFYINDAFSISHRKNASIVAITKFLPSYVGLSLENEIKNLSRIMKNPKRPLVIILGGAKISDKIGVIKNFLERADYFLIGGGVANTFLAAQGLPIGDSLYEKEMIPTAKKLSKSPKIILPIDSMVKKGKILDIGPKTAKKYAEIIKNAKTIIWNGPMGYIEDKRFIKGTEAITKAIMKSRAFSVIGGGETTAAFQAAARNYADKYTELRRKYPHLFLSTGGGAMLEYLAGKKLSGIVALQRNIKKL